MTLVLDANILIAFALADEPLHTQATEKLLAWQSSAETLIAPRLFRSELTAVVRKAVYQGRIAGDQGRAILVRLLEYPVTLYEDDALLMAAYDLAARFNRPRAYDTQYMALAERFGCPFWTADERLVNSTQGTFSLIRWLGNR